MKKLKKKLKKSIKKNCKIFTDSNMPIYVIIGSFAFIFINSLESWGFGWVIPAVIILISIPIIYGIIIVFSEYIDNKGLSNVLSVIAIYIIALAIFGWLGVIAVIILLEIFKGYVSFTKRIDKIDNKLDKLIN